jgi:biopolymer transport protein ExbD
VEEIFARKIQEHNGELFPRGWNYSFAFVHVGEGGRFLYPIDVTDLEELEGHLQGLDRGMGVLIRADSERENGMVEQVRQVVEKLGGKVSGVRYDSYIEVRVEPEGWLSVRDVEMEVEDLEKLLERVGHEESVLLVSGHLEHEQLIEQIRDVTKKNGVEVRLVRFQAAPSASLKGIRQGARFGVSGDNGKALGSEKGVETSEMVGSGNGEKDRFKSVTFEKLKKELGERQIIARRKELSPAAGDTIYLAVVQGRIWHRAGDASEEMSGKRLRDYIGEKRREDPAGKLVIRFGGGAGVEGDSLVAEIQKVGREEGVQTVRAWGANGEYFAKEFKEFKGSILRAGMKSGWIRDRPFSPSLADSLELIWIKKGEHAFVGIGGEGRTLEEAEQILRRFEGELKVTIVADSEREEPKVEQVRKIVEDAGLEVGMIDYFNHIKVNIDAMGEMLVKGMKMEPDGLEEFLKQQKKKGMDEPVLVVSGHLDHEELIERIRDVAKRNGVQVRGLRIQAAPAETRVATVGIDDARAKHIRELEEEFIRAHQQLKALRDGATTLTVSADGKMSLGDSAVGRLEVDMEDLGSVLSAWTSERGEQGRLLVKAAPETKATRIAQVMDTAHRAGWVDQVIEGVGKSASWPMSLWETAVDETLHLSIFKGRLWHRQGNWVEKVMDGELLGLLQDGKDEKTFGRKVVSLSGDLFSGDKQEMLIFKGDERSVLAGDDLIPFTARPERIVVKVSDDGMLLEKKWMTLSELERSLQALSKSVGKNASLSIIVDAGSADFDVLFKQVLEVGKVAREVGIEEHRVAFE